jgi:mannose-6-phosphate isomerase-like protein (cupin superfamily)
MVGFVNRRLAYFLREPNEWTAMAFATKRAAETPDAIAPDGSEVRILSGLSRGGSALFSLAPGAVTKAVAHRTVEEIWYVIQGRGWIWRKLEDNEELVELGPGVSVDIPTGTHFQFRCDGHETLTILGVTMPPWPGADEAYVVAGVWPPKI